MNNPAINFAKEHPVAVASVFGGIGLLIYLMNRSTPTESSASSFYGNQSNLAALNNQNAATQAQYAAMENIAAYQTQAKNNETSAALAAVATQYNATIETAKINADVINKQTMSQESVATTYINAASESDKAQLALEANSLENQFAYLTQVHNDQVEMAKIVLPGAIKNLDNASNISANATNIIDTILGNTSTAVAASQTEAIKQNASAYKSAAMWSGISSIVSAAGKAATGLFA